MKRNLFLTFLVVSVLVVSVGFVIAGNGNGNGDSCTTIQSGELEASTGETLTTGYDEFGYNYQAHIFNGRYCDFDRNSNTYQEYCDIDLQMKWNDAWLSNKDCDEDKTLDRHYGYDSYIGSGAWLTNHMRGIDENGEEWTYFVKIVAMPEEDYDCENPIWGQFCVIQEVNSGDGSTFYGEIPGLGIW